MSLMLHVNAKDVDYDGLRLLDTPPATQTHVPIAHYRVVDLVKSTLGMYGHEVVQQHYGITEDGSRFFGLLSLRSHYGDYTDTVGLRNSHDKSFPIGIGFGSRVFVCDNMAFVADHIVKRKHTANLKRDLPGLVGEIIEPLALVRDRQRKQVLTYQHTSLTPEESDHAILDMYRQNVITERRIPDVMDAYENPPHDWGEETVWRLFNAATFTLTGRVMEHSDVTPRLHKILDGVCTVQ